MRHRGNFLSIFLIESHIEVSCAAIEASRRLPENPFATFLADFLATPPAARSPDMMTLLFKGLSLFLIKDVIKIKACARMRVPAAARGLI